MAWAWKSPEIALPSRAGFPLITIVGIALSALFATRDNTVGSREDVVWSHCPSTKSIEFAPTRVKLEIPGSMVTEDVRVCRSSISGSVGLVTPRT